MSKCNSFHQLLNNLLFLFLTYYQIYLNYFLDLLFYQHYLRQHLNCHSLYLWLPIIKHLEHLSSFEAPFRWQHFWQVTPLCFPIFRTLNQFYCIHATIFWHYYQVSHGFSINFFSVLHYFNHCSGFESHHFYYGIHKLKQLEGKKNI
jgi:hypothetical protein